MTRRAVRDTAFVNQLKLVLFFSCDKDFAVPVSPPLKFAAVLGTIVSRPD